MLLSINNIKVHYGKAEALKGVSLELDQGMIIALIGSNGAGKTTMLRAISGLKTPTSGEIWFDGNRMDGKRPEYIVRLGISHVPEGRRVFATMTVQENLELGAYLCNSRRQIDQGLEAVFKRFPVLVQKRRQTAGSLSGGEQQMLATARGLMAKPRLLLMDEPSLGLSPLLVREVTSMILRINQDGISIILVEQNARLALKISHRAYVLETGNIALEGDSKDLLNDEHVRKAYLGG